MPYDDDGVFVGVSVRGYNSYDADAVSRETGHVCEGASLAQQQFKEECDINVIVERFGLTGEIPGDYKPPVSGDFTNVPDFQSAMNAVRGAQESFMQLPAQIRARFHNDPGELIAFLDVEDNRAEALKLGIIQPPPERTRDVVQAVDELAAKLVPKA